MPQIVVTTVNDRGEQDQFRMSIGTGTEPEYEVMITEQVERLRMGNHMDWSVSIIDNKFNVLAERSLSDEGDDQFFYLLTQEGYAWNSQIRDNMDVVVYRLYQKLSR